MRKIKTNPTKANATNKKLNVGVWEAYARIEKSVDMRIFNAEDIKGKMEKLFSEIYGQFLKRYDEISKFLKLKDFKELSVDNIFAYFKGFFYEQILNEAVSLTVNGKNDFNLKVTLFYCLTKEKLEKAITRKPMIDAFEKAINNIDEKYLSSKQEKIEALKKQFPVYTKTNYCGGCGCECQCDEGCNGDWQKCTSEKALEKHCSHCCSCYMRAMLENMDFKQSYGH